MLGRLDKSLLDLLPTHLTIQQLKHYLYHTITWCYGHLDLSFPIIGGVDHIVDFIRVSANAGPH